MAEYAVASVYAQTGAKKDALRHLERALTGRARGIRPVINSDFVKKDPALAALRDEPEFKALVARF